MTNLKISVEGPEEFEAAPCSPMSSETPTAYEFTDRNMECVISAPVNANDFSRIESNRKVRSAMIAKLAILKHKRRDTAGSADEGGAASSGRTKISGEDVKNIFLASCTLQTVNKEQIERIEMMHDKISEGARFGFNYICLLLIASIVAGLGLISNSSTIVISSMLLSPIMGPVIGIAYGVIVWDWALVRRSVRNELISIFVCIIIGMIVCITTAWTDIKYTWPTAEMSGRGDTTNFLIGIPVAFLSGLGVALSVLDDSTSSLVGVAVSASLLPPAVNAGLCWLFSVLLQSDAANTERGEEFRQEEFAKMGGISLALTVLNIVLVAIASMFMFRMKEVLPVKKHVFWNDLKTARKINQRRALLVQQRSMNVIERVLSGDDGNGSTSDEENV